MPVVPPSGGLAITNPLVLYRSLVATKRILPDAGQHRLAIRLQSLYESIKDYEPTIEYSQRLRDIGRALNEPGPDSSDSRGVLHGNVPDTGATKATWRSLLAQKENKETLQMTRTMTKVEATRNLSSPKGLMLHGEVGTGKSMLIDLFADCLPTYQKRRWHFNTFSLDVFARLEQYRKSSLADQAAGREHAMLALARDLIKTSPILFLDEFQLPDRATSKIMTNLMVSFFELGGVLVATSNRMPDELDKAAGVTFASPPSRLRSMRWRFGLTTDSVGRSETMFAGNSEFVEFLDILKSRCDVWEMQGKEDYRRRESMTTASDRASSALSSYAGTCNQPSSEQSPDHVLVEPSVSTNKDPTRSGPDRGHESSSTLTPLQYVLTSQGNHHADLLAAQNRIKDFSTAIWKPSQFRVYGRDLILSTTHDGIALCSFADLCDASLGPADYITIASTFHTLILTDIPVLFYTKKNEARRFITLLDALYEARCKLLVSAHAGPDELFFPDGPVENVKGSDAVLSETFSEAFQDAVAPFRPNVSTQSPRFSEPEYAPQPDYTHARMQKMLAPDSLEDDPPNRISRRSEAFDTIQESPATRQTPNFTNFGAFTGEDERFAYKRARSRLWEMTGARWWAREEPDWHKPVPSEVRRWEQDATAAARNPTTSEKGDGQIGSAIDVEEHREVLFRHGASPFRTAQEPPPKFNWTHVWGTMKWGKKAGAWGQGVDGLKDRKGGR